MICMEAWMDPTRARFGIPWPDTYIKFQGDVVSWYTKMQGLREFGQMVIDAHAKEGGLEAFLQEVHALAKRLDALFAQLERSDWKEMKDAELLEKYELVRKCMQEWFVPGAVCEPVGIQGEHLVLQLLKNSQNPQHCLSTLTTTTKKSFSRRETEELLALAQKAIEKQDISAALRSHARKWFWLHNNYFSTDVLGEEYFNSELKTIFSKYPNPRKTIDEMELAAKEIAHEKLELAKNLALDTAQKRLIEVLDAHAWYQDYRKEYVMILLHCLDVILAEIATRKGTALREIKWLLPSEVASFFHGELGKGAIEARKKSAFFLWEKDKFSSYSGTDARKKELQTLKPINSAREIIEIPGSVASRGMVRGNARVTMSPHEAKDLQKGEILVTSMTSPDFIIAIKKCAAIVTNEGGILCHAAIVSREFGIPCVVGTGIATQAIKTGDLLEVDATHGFVRILKR